MDSAVRESAWTVATIPRCLENRSVEIKGEAAVDVVYAGLSCGADVYVVDLACARDREWDSRVLDTLSFASRADSPEHRTTVLMVRLRPLLLSDDLLTVGDRQVSAGVVDLVLNTVARSEYPGDDTGIFLYLPDVGSREEAKVWNTVVELVAEELGMGPGAIFTTAEISCAGGASEAEEILWELRRNVTGLNIRYIEDAVGIGTSTSVVAMERGGFISRRKLGEIFEMCNRRGAQAICGVRNDVPLRVGNRNVQVSLSRAVPTIREFRGRWEAGGVLLKEAG